MGYFATCSFRAYSAILVLYHRAVKRPDFGRLSW